MMRSRVEDFRSPSPKQSPRVGQETLLLEKIQFSLQKPLDQRCNDVWKMIEEFPIEDLNLFYPHLLASIFGFTTNKNWALHTPHSRNAEGLRRFLGPRGIVWKLIEKLERDTFLRYEFPVTCLPKPAQSSFAEGQIPAFYYNKLQFSGTPQVPSVVNIGALEYFLFHFAYFITHSTSQMEGRSQEQSHDTVYTALLTDYLEFFLPTTTSLLRPERYPGSAYPKTETKRYFNTPEAAHPRTSTLFSGLIKSFEKNKPCSYTPSFEHSKSQLLQSETFLQVLMEFWLNQILDKERNTFPPFVQDYFLPSVDHVRVVRMLVKHLHTFMIVNIHEFEGVSPMEIHKDFYRSFMPDTLRIFKRSLFCFIHHCFVQWPLDSSFRFILETWLSYVQPWRYGVNQGTLQTQNNPPQFPVFWVPFVHHNLLFYTVLFQEFLNRAEKLNLRSSRDTQLFYRVAKVFSQKSLMPIVHEVEDDLISYLSSTQPHLRESPRSPKSPEYVHFMELSTSGTVYKPLFMTETIDNVRCLVHRVKNTLQSLREPQSRDSQTSPNLGWFKRRVKNTINWIQDVFSIDEQYWLILDENRKAEKNLEFITEQLRGIFQISDEGPPERTIVGEVDGSTSTLSHISSQSSGDNSPDCVETEDGLVLTALGKYQMANGLRRFTIQYSGDPALQPVRSYEVVFVVRALYKLSTILNEKFGPKLTDIYYSPGWTSSVARHLSPAVQQPRTLSPVKYKRTQASNEHEQPKISLRYLASSRLWAQLFLFMFVLIFVFGRPWSAVFLTILIIFVMFLRHIHVVKRNDGRAKAEDESLVT